MENQSNFNNFLSIKDEKFQSFLKEQFDEKALPFIDWAKATNLENKITPIKLEKLVLLFEGGIDFNLVTKAVLLDTEVEKEMLDVFSGKVIDKKKQVENNSDSIKDGNFHIVLKEQFGEKANPFIEWAKETSLDNKITQIKLEKLVLLYEDNIEFNLVEKAISLSPEVKDEMLNIFKNRKNNVNLANKESSTTLSEGIKDGKFHIVLKEQFGNKADPFIEWAKKTNLESKISQGKLEKLVLLYDGAIEFNLVDKALSLDPEVKKDMFNIFEDQKITNQASRKNKM
jgi:pyruvate formate-lyase activating enzyme-like uncharacterized protein